MATVSFRKHVGLLKTMCSGTVIGFHLPLVLTLAAVWVVLFFFWGETGAAGS